MKMKIIVLLLVLCAVLLSGCAGNEQPSPEENVTSEETVTPGENVTPVQPETPEENITAEETETPGENITSEETVTPGETVTSEEDGRLNVSTSEIKETPYMIRLINKRASSSSLEIKKGESVSWINMEDNPKRVLTLVSEEKLFENTGLVYKRAFTYAFNETGDYQFSVVGQPRMNVSISVAEP
jgi:PBP1b-binding outer membrane lipoprotein LpoB